jgi:hypothetical protein
VRLTTQAFELRMAAALAFLQLIAVTGLMLCGATSSPARRTLRQPADAIGRRDSAPWWPPPSPVWWRSW